MRGRLPILLTVALLAASLPISATAAEAPWTPVTPAPPLHEELSGAGFNDVAAMSPTDVWAVGSGWSTVDVPLIEHWTGTAWDPVEEPSVPNFQYTLSGVDAVSARDVWAAGSGMRAPQPDFFSYVAVIAHYDGTTWSLVPTPAPPPMGLYGLTDIDMMSATDGWAVGWQAGPNRAFTQPLVLRWRNGRWVTVRLPDVGGDHVMLNHVHAHAGNDVWAVGYAEDSALVMHFDGTRWSRIAVPHDGAADAGNALGAVAVVSAGEVWAVGSTCPAEIDPTCQPLVLHLSGGVWQVVPTAGDRGTFLLDVVARSSNDVWVVGYDNPPGVRDNNYVEHWDGQRFTSVPADAGSRAARSGLASALEAVTRIPGTAELWAVGWQDYVPQVIWHG